MTALEYDNDRDRFSHGFDAGSIIDGTIRIDPETGEYVIVDEDGKAFSSQKLFYSLNGKKIRFTCISIESIETIEAMIGSVNSTGSTTNV